MRQAFVSDLINFLLKERSKLLINTLKPVVSVPRRAEAVIAANCGPTSHG